MKKHSYLRAYMAGIVVPTMFMLVIFGAFITARFVYEVPAPIERVLVFPMALVPNLFGVWNMLFVSLQSRRWLPIGFHGALLPFILAPLGLIFGASLGFVTLGPAALVWIETITIPYTLGAIMFPLVVAVYYLVWKHIVGFLNGMLGVA